MTFQPGHRAKTQGRRGKIMFLPPKIRNEINRRLEDNGISREIAQWLNSQEEVRKILDEKWDGQTMSPQAVETWRRSGYQEWRRKREQIENLKELSEHALKLGQAAGGSVADGSAAIVGGRIMAAIETASDDDMLKLVRAISELRAGDINRARLEQNKQRLAQHKQKLELERLRFQRQTAELFLKWYDDKRAREIVESRDGNAAKIELLGRAMFGEAWRC